MSAFPRLDRHEIALLRMLIARPRDRIARSIGMALDRRERRIAAPLWRRGLVDAFYRQAPDSEPSLQGPFFALSFAGWKLAQMFTRPRGLAARPQSSGSAA